SHSLNNRSSTTTPRSAGISAEDAKPFGTRTSCKSHEDYKKYNYKATTPHAAVGTDDFQKALFLKREIIGTKETSEESEGATTNKEVLALRQLLTAWQKAYKELEAAYEKAELDKKILKEEKAHMAKSHEQSKRAAVQSAIE
ncbi:unnamed protein product, partial [Amoebophrya sp. A25]